MIITNQRSIKAQRTFLPYHFLAKLVSERGANTEQVPCPFVKKSSILVRVSKECCAELAWAWCRNLEVPCQFFARVNGAKPTIFVMFILLKITLTF